MKRLILFILISLFIIGCAKHIKYTHPTKGTYEFDYDRSECLRMAHEYANKMGSKDDILLVSTQTDGCLEKRGWIKEEKVSFFDTLEDSIKDIFHKF
ncbi:MAG TPA: hypothetical protein VEF33_09715 [Syntrophales bacterium]|nr:hypothetical protein [Syntrophales bacterium]